MARDNDITVFVRRCFASHSMLTIFSTLLEHCVHRHDVITLRHGHEETDLLESWESSELSARNCQESREKQCYT